MVDQDVNELFIGMVGALGSDLDFVIDKLSLSLESLGYTVERISVSSLMQILDEYRNIPTSPEDLRINEYMNAGNQLREKTGKNDILSRFAISKVWEKRMLHKDQRVVYIFKSLKHPSEIELLRKVYRDSFYVISVYTPRDKRQENLRRRIAQSRQKQYADAEIKGIVEKLIERDESEKELTASGQNVRETYVEADVFIDLTNVEECEKAVKRFVELIHGNTFHTPNNDEFAMFTAYAASRRSGSLSRQVGAVITNDHGDIIATGMNEVPKVSGGVFIKDPGNYMLGYDPNDRYKNYVLHDLMLKFVDLGIINKSEIDIDKFIEENKKILKHTYLMNIIEYAREVHAEMTALSSVSRNLTRMKDCILYSTTFPCHICTKHIISSGMHKVVYIEPYPKSLAGELFTEFITVDESEARNGTVLFTSYVGVAPRCYMKIFEMSERKDTNGNVIKWKPLEAKLRYYEEKQFYLIREIDIIKDSDVLIPDDFKRDMEGSRINSSEDS